MAIIKCKMCGGDLEVVAESRVAVCEYCGTQQTVPSADNEKKLTLFARANRLRMACEFDKAAGVYESIVADFPEEAEAYWGLVLCKYGIEYVNDPTTGKKIPTCHRSSFDSVMDDSNLEQALENADAIARRVYRDEAKAIEELRKGIIEVSGKEEPYDIFICYKETDDNGDRTIDSVIAQEVYDALTEKGYRVFFSRITLEDKLGQEYEPYIFAALHSAKIMLAFGTDYEYYNAVWVKNEWSRFLQLIAAGEKKTLIPCYKNIDAYDMPKEFARLQAQDMGKVGAMQDLLRGIEKILPREKAVVKETVEVQQSAETTKVQALLERAFLFLEDGDWNAANEYCEKALDIDPKCAEGYLGKLMIDLKVRRQAELVDCAKPFDGNGNYIKVIRFADANLKNTLSKYLDEINYRIANAPLEEIYSRAKGIMEKASTEEDYKSAAETFATIAGYKDADELLNICLEKAEVAGKDAILADAEKKMTVKTVASYEKAIALLETIPGWRDADDKLVRCKKKLEELKKELEITRKKMEEDAKKTRKVIMIAAPIVCMIIAVVFLLFRVIIPGNKYDEALAMVENGQHEEAMELFGELKADGYKDSAEQVTATQYLLACTQFEKGDYQNAYANFVLLKDYKDSEERMNESAYAYAQVLMAEENYEEAIELLKVPDAPERMKELRDQCRLEGAKKYYAEEKYEEAVVWYQSVEGYEELDEYIDACYNYGLELLEEKNYEKAIKYFNLTDGYKDAEEQVLAAKYGYVNAHKNNKSRMTHTFLKDLKEAGYKDSASIYKELYTWKVELVFCNTDPDDYKTKLSSIPKNTNYLHMSFQFSRGVPGEKITMYHTNQWPGKTKSTSDWYWENETIDSEFGVQWPDGTSSSSGTYTIEFYNATTGGYIDKITIPVG